MKTNAPGLSPHPVRNESTSALLSTRLESQQVLDCASPPALLERARTHGRLGQRPESARFQNAVARIVLILGVALSVASFAPNAWATEPVQLTIMGLSLEGVPTLQLSGTTPGTYRIEASPDLRSWQPVTTNTLANSPVVFADPTAAGLAHRFYRAVLLDATPAYQPGIVLLRFKPTASDASVASVFDAVPLTLGEEIWTSAMQDAGQDPILCMHTTLPVLEAVRQLTNNPAIDFAEPNWIRELLSVSNDPKFMDGSLWGMYGDASSPANTFGSQAAEAWEEGYTGSANICVGVIDTGINVTHPDLVDNIWTNPGEVPGNGRDDDGNGLVDDVHGWNFNGGNNDVFGNPSVNSHGTHVAGTIGARGGNGQGVAGVNWRVSIIPAKFLGEQLATTDKLVKAIDYLSTLKKAHGANIVAINNSYGYRGTCGPRFYSRAEHEAIIRAAKQDILFVCAAGNDTFNNDDCPNYPANYDTTVGTPSTEPAGYNAVVTVAAMDRTGQLADFSNFGRRTVALGAPGVAVLSTWPGGGYYSIGGTSMAAPHVTGAAALYASTHPGASAAQIRTALLGSTVPTPSLAGKCVTGGRLNLSTVIRPDPPASCLVLYVDAAYTGSVEDGSAARPFKALRSATSAACAGAVLHIRPGQYHEGTLAPGKALLLQPEGGTVRVSP